MSDGVQFKVLVSLFNWIFKSKSHSAKRAKFRKYLDLYCKSDDYFSSIRLILPSLDRERGSYGLKESVLATSLLDALGISRDSEDAKKLINWRKGGTKIAGDIAGNFALVAADILQRRQSSAFGDLTIRELNELLDRLANAENRTSKTEILGDIIRRTNSEEMKWIIKIILKDLKLGISEKSIFHEFHPDAEDLFNVTCDLRFVCEKLNDKNIRHKRQDIEVAKAVRAQLAERASNCAFAWKKLHGKEVVAECKFDGDRIQIHKNGNKVHYFSRNFIDHTEYEHGMSNVILENVVVDRCILDGEMLVWDNASNRFASWGKNQEIAKAAREGLDGEHQLCYVAFDVLYVGDTSVIHQTLKERHEHLKKVVRPVKGRLQALLPNGSGKDNLNTHQSADEPCWSIVAHNLDEADRFYKAIVENRDEGIVLKDLGSKWEPGDRSWKWIKVKPDYDYFNAGSDLDVLIIGGYYGSGRKGGEVAQFLVGLAEKAAPGAYPRRFVSFCRVGTGLSDDELDELVTKLKPYLRKYEYPKMSPPSFYQVTNHFKERPDVWVESPEKSVIVSITSDIRTISSEVFAAPYSLRFPRIDRLRYDKPWHECLDVQSFIKLVQLSNGTTQRGGGANNDGLSADKPKRRRAAKNGAKKKLNLTVPSHFTQTDVSSVKGESRIFANMVFHFVNLSSSHSLDSMHKLVVENGGTFSMNLNDTVTHSIGGESRGIKFEAAKRRGCDVIHHSWVLNCCSQKQLLPLRPQDFVFLSDSTKKKLQEEVDELSDSYFWDVNVTELKQIFCNVSRSENTKAVDYYKKKYCPREEWVRFHGCCVYFHLFAMSHFPEWDIFLKVSMRRMKVEVSLGGGKVSDNPSQATHVVVMSVPGPERPEHELKFETLLQSFPEDQKHLLRKKRLHVVRSHWLVDCCKEKRKLSEELYNLRPTALEEESASEEEKGENDDEYEKHPSPAYEVKPKKIDSKTIASRIREPKRKRGRQTETSTRKRKIIVSKPPRQKRARVGSRPAKLQDFTVDDEPSEQETDVAEASPELEMHDHDFQDVAFDDKSSEQGTNTVVKTDSEPEDSGSARRNHVLEKIKENRIEEHNPDFDTTGSRCLENFSTVGCITPEKDEDNSTLRNSEVMDSPAEAMSLDKNPNRQDLSEASNAVFNYKNLPSSQSLEESSVKPLKGEPVKKKKVSYKELVMQLLKD
ncbi:DNA ligase 4 [Amaranthus tricolor]|uniref:DNA ligase 4 n=1 Tax=Amaranthus tricolor TaxID=29722 RepID=UPI0025865804|nr:DNA ligase 4 [Amaranthus tricolor]